MLGLHEYKRSSKDCVSEKSDHWESLFGRWKF